MNPKVILDIGFLGHAHDDPAARRGAQRVAMHLFDGLLKSAKCDLSFVATSHLAGAYDFLKERGLDADQRLAFHQLQLGRSRRARDLGRRVQRTMQNRSWLARTRRRVLAEISRRQLRGEVDFPPETLQSADIYHSPHTPFPAAVHEHKKIRKFITCHDFIPLKHPEFFSSCSPIFMNGVLACLEPENFAFCVSETTRNDVLNFSSMPPERVFVSPLAASPELFFPVIQPELLRSARQKFQLGEKPFFLALSAHDPHKNFPFLIRCFGALVESGELKDSNLVIVGHNLGRNPDAQKAVAEFPKVKDRILIAGFVPDQELAALYSSATAFLFPSLAEGFGIPPLEAMQCGIPVIASNTTSMPEVVGDAGILLAPTAKDAWCQAMLSVARDESLRAKLSKKSLQRSKLFSWQRFIDETLRGYKTSMEMQ
jgi:glycosyltransferase involved in cell wall biosynthesis